MLEQQRSRRIALIRLGALGDVVLTASLVRALSEAGHSVTLVTSKALAPIAKAIPELDRFVLRDSDRDRGLAGLRRVAHAVGAVDVVVDLQNKPRSYLLAQLISARQRRALRKRTLLGGLAGLLGRDRVLRGPHQVELNRRVVEDLLEARADLALLAQPHRMRPPRPVLSWESADPELIALVPGAAHATKRWPPQRYGELARALLVSGHAVRVVTGPGEVSLLRAVEKGAGQSLSHTSGAGVDAVLRTCAASKLVIGGDTGPMHVAAALDRPVIALFGPTSVARWGPLTGGAVLRRSIDCRPCSNHGQARCPLGHHRCMLEISVADVVERAALLLGEVDA